MVKYAIFDIIHLRSIDAWINRGAHSCFTTCMCLGAFIDPSRESNPYISPFQIDQRDETVFGEESQGWTVET